jgi:DNA-binding NarL/FixJ family response regulator
MSIIKVVIADDHPFVLKGIGDYLRSAEDISIVAACINGKLALEKIRELQPDVALLDVSMPEMSGFDVLRAVNRENLPTRILFLAALAGPRDIITAMAEGAYGFLQKDSRPPELLYSIREIAAGRKCIPFELLGRSADDEPMVRPIESLLTQREWKVMALAAAGQSNKEIARSLNIASGTAKIHLHHIFRKVGVKNRTALATIAFRNSSDDRKPH